jgi:glucokinase-like ROK family protein
MITHGVSSRYINKLNKIQILNIIREKEQISRADISKISKISAPTVTRIVDHLIHSEGLVKEIGIGISSGGRRPTLVKFSAEDNFVIGIDLGKTHIDGVLANLNAEFITEIQIKANLENGFENIMDRTADIICELRNDPNVKGKKIFGVGMAVAGVINKRDNVVELSPDFQWENVNIKKYLKEKCDLPLIFDNVTRVMALGELWYGIGKKVKNFIMMNVGYGIGGGIIIEGEPYFGPFGMAGEFGHITMDKNSNHRCDCGNYGCLEALASGRAIADKMRDEIKKGKDTIIREWIGEDYSLITARLVADAARRGDKVAMEIFSEAVEYIGIAIAGLINLLSPEYVLIGGGVAQSGDLIFEKIREIVHHRSLKTKSKKVVVAGATFGMKAASKGAVSLILNEVINLNFSNNN